jgi:hypothetical protein
MISSKIKYQKTLFSNNDRLIIKFSVTSLLIAEIFIGFPFLIWLFGVIRYPINIKAWIGCVIIFIFGILVYLWFNSYHIEIINGILKYRSPFSGIKQIPLSDIEHAHIDIGVLGKNDIYHGFVRLVLNPKMTSQAKGFYINLKVFEKNGVKQLLCILPMKD